MNNPRTILVALRDPETAASALARARQLARPGDTVAFIHVARANLFALLGAGELRHAMPDTSLRELTAAAWLDELKSSPIFAPGVRLESDTLSGNPGEAIGEYARRTGASVIVTAAPRLGVLHEYFLGSTALGILRHAPCPVLVARAVEAKAWRSVAAAIDLDAAGERVLAAVHSLLADSALTLLHSYRVPNETLLRTTGLAEDTLAGLRQQMRLDVEQRIKPFHALAPAASIRIQEGYAAPAILELVTAEQPDLLALSQHRGSAREQRIIGSVTQYLLYKCPCDLLLVP